MKEETENEIWRKGYDLGMKNALQQNSQALAIGNAILAVLDNRYEFAKTDY